MKGNLTRRGKSSWRLKFDTGRDPVTGRRITKFVTLRGTKAQAQAEATKILAEVAAGTHVGPSKVTVGEFVRARVSQWEAAGTISARSARRYGQLVEHQIMPHIGGRELQKLKPLDVEQWHTGLRTSGRVRGSGGVAARTIGHAHRILSKALKDAAKNGLVSRNVATLESPPKVTDTEMVIVRDVPALLEKLQGSALRVPALLGVLCGMRLGEVLALRWNRVNLDAKIVQVRETLEPTETTHGIRFKSPKSRAGSRDISMPDEVVDALREYRRNQRELRMQLGAGKLPDDALLFANINGQPRSLYAVSAAWRVFAKRIGMPGLTFHCLRHSHASQLIHEGVDIVTISKRLGHAKPDITLRIYAHLFQKDDSRAAAAINAALKR
jgi:integrase